LIPYENAFGQKPVDTSAILALVEDALYYSNVSALYSTTKECPVCIVGIAESRGDTMTWFLLDDATKLVVSRF
jgi:hypothetical protein